MIGRYLTLGAVATFDKHVLVRRESKVKDCYGLEIYRKETGEIIESILFMKHTKIFYQNNVRQEDGIIILTENIGIMNMAIDFIGDGEFNSSFHSSFHEIGKYRATIVKPQCVAMPYNGTEQVIFTIEHKSEDKYILSKVLVGGKGYRHDLELGSSMEFVWRASENGIYLGTRKWEATGWKYHGQELYKVAERDSSGLWTALNKEELVKDSEETYRVVNSEGVVWDWFTEVRF
jgi:hypothetical protein